VIFEDTDLASYDEEPEKRQESMTGTFETPHLGESLIKASCSAESWSFSCLSKPLFPHLSSEGLRKIVSKIHRNCLRFRQALFNQ